MKAIVSVSPYSYHFLRHSLPFAFSLCQCSWWLQEFRVCTTDSSVCAWWCVMRTRTWFLEWMRGKEVEEFNKAVALHFQGLLQHTFTTHHSELSINPAHTGSVCPRGRRGLDGIWLLPLFLAFSLHLSWAKQSLSFYTYTEENSLFPSV